MDKLKEALEKNKESWEKKVEVRQEYNLKCLSVLGDIILNHPELRFGQILYNLNLNGDIFNEESVDTYERIKEKIK